ncbi:unnamed protein product [Rotaria sp. Silwood2]|nr:unnamed protein product [Rotaria sp. Silwood2]
MKLDEIWSKHELLLAHISSIVASENELLSSVRSSSSSSSSSQVQVENSPSPGEVNIANTNLCNSSITDEVQVVNKNLCYSGFTDEAKAINENLCNLCISIPASANENRSLSSIRSSSSSHVQVENSPGTVNTVNTNLYNSCISMATGEIVSLSSIRSSSSSHVQVEKSPGKVNIVNTNLYNSCISMATGEVVSLSSVPSPSLSHVKVGNFADEIKVAHKSSNNKNRKNENSTPTQSKHRTQYLTEWEKRPEAQYKTHVFDEFGTLHERSMCWLYMKENSMGCRLCEKYGVHEGVIAKLRHRIGTDCLELNRCVAHSFALVGSHASYELKTESNKQPVLAESVVKLEETISKIYNYFNTSPGRQFKLKLWQNFLEIPELKFKRIFDIRWSSIRDCIKPIIVNIQPGSQALIGYLQEAMYDFTLSALEREHSKNLFNLILDDEILLLIHMHYDLHESILGPITKLMQNDQLSYFNLMEMIKEKKNILRGWTFQSTSATGPALSDYLESTKNGSFGAFKVNLGDRKKIFNSCREHINRLLEELARRFQPSLIQENLSILFDPQYLFQHKKDINSNEYGRSALDFLRKKYKNFVDFDFNSVRNEWESLKASLYDYVNSLPTDYSVKDFWKSYILQKQLMNNGFYYEFKNILLLLNVYLISPTNSTECERGFSAINRIQTIGRSRLMVSTLDSLMTVRMLLKDDLRSSRCQQVVCKAFESWNDRDHNRRLYQVQLLIDASNDYEPQKQVRSVVKRNLSLFDLEMMHKKPKKPKAKSIKCANGCKTEVSGTDLKQSDAIQCCHQSEQFDWIEQTDNCSRWLCNSCRIKLSIDIDSLWFCCDHADMHDDEDETCGN